MKINIVDLGFWNSNMVNRSSLYSRPRKPSSYALGQIISHPWPSPMIGSTPMVKSVGELDVLSVGHARDVTTRCMQVENILIEREQSLYFYA